MNLPKISSIFSLFVGLSMIGLWTMLLFTGGVPELVTEPFRIVAHILAEVATAVLLLISAVGLWVGSSWRKPVFFFSLGALFYTLIASPGYYLQLGVFPIVLMFVVILIITIGLFSIAIIRPESYEL